MFFTKCIIELTSVWFYQGTTNGSTTRSDEATPGVPTPSPWPTLSLELDAAAAWGRKLYPPGATPTRTGAGLMFGLHHHQDPSTGLHHHQPRGPSLKEEPLTRGWMQSGITDQNGWVFVIIQDVRFFFS